MNRFLQTKNKGKKTTTHRQTLKIHFIWQNLYHTYTQFAYKVYAFQWLSSQHNQFPFQNYIIHNPNRTYINYLLHLNLQTFSLIALAHEQTHERKKERKKNAENEKMQLCILNIEEKKNVWNNEIEIKQLKYWTSSRLLFRTECLNKNDWVNEKLISIKKQNAAKSSL